MSSFFYYWNKHMQQRITIAALLAIAFTFILITSMHRQAHTSILFSSIIILAGTFTILYGVRLIVSDVSVPLKRTKVAPIRAGMYSVVSWRENGEHVRQLHSSDGIVQWEWNSRYRGNQRILEVNKLATKERWKLASIKDEFAIITDKSTIEYVVERHVIPSEFTVHSEETTYTIRREKDKLILSTERKVLGVFEWTKTYETLQSIYGSRQRVVSMEEEHSPIPLFIFILAIDEWFDYYTML